MIRYSLKCDQDHGFESWFQSAAAFDDLAAAGRLSCPVCGSVTVDKTLMAPAVRPARKAAPGALAAPGSKVEEALAALRKQVEENSEYVGLNFAAEARAIHEGDAPQRAIYGEAKLEEARRLVEDGVPVAPLPFMPPRKVN
ncbi:DUF1178 domain-containing protein [Cereibacter changlensis JA139]|uniref:DUF1178 domain-containing protein n=2 Tax=Cereibacter changlensis TaxID=402884 RepID=A0A2T4JX13_9RHOB|nr:DUF1178 family protein [Cereibacter changlensis]PTE22454.1 DUF1178 domain-containing protein [Cereibacter changlensis JA139]PZX51637.1 hypothetical protein LX76_02987 [Cereibacter changlensis]